MNLHRSLRKRSLLVISFICSLFIMVHFSTVQAGSTLAVDRPAVYTEGTIVLTPGSSTSKDYQPGKSDYTYPRPDSGNGFPDGNTGER